jgi:hypothetical protein
MVPYTRRDDRGSRRDQNPLITTRSDDASTTAGPVPNVWGSSPVWSS